MNDQVIQIEQLPAALQELVSTMLPVLGLELSKAAMRHLFANIVAASPVGDPAKDPHPGLYRDSHTVSVGAPVFREMPKMPTYPIPGDAEADAGMSAAQPGEALFVATEAKPEGTKRGYADVLEGGRRQISRIKTRTTLWIGSEQAPEGVYDEAVKVTLEEHATIEEEAITATEQRIG